MIDELKRLEKEATVNWKELERFANFPPLDDGEFRYNITHAGSHI